MDYYHYKNNINDNISNKNNFFKNKNNLFNLKISIYLNSYSQTFYKKRIFKNPFILTNLNLYFIYIFNKNFVSFFFNFNFEKKNFLILDTNYSYIFPLYKYIFGVNTLHFYKNFFFLKPIYFTHKN